MIQYDPNKYLWMCTFPGSVLPISFLYALPASLATIPIRHFLMDDDATRDIAKEFLGNAHVWSSITVILVIMLTTYAVAVGQGWQAIESITFGFELLLLVFLYLESRQPV